MLIKENNEYRWVQAYKKIQTPESNPCEKCNMDNKCTIFCPARAKWWDASMAKIRKRLGVKA